MRLQKYLSGAGVASRREAETLIAAGKVYVNGRKAELGQRVIPGEDRVMCRGKVVEVEETVSFLFHKPRGFLCNPDGRREGETIFDAFPELRGYRVALGLGRMESGLMLLTNDGDLMQRVGQNIRSLERTFRLRIGGELDEKTLSRVQKGLKIDDRLVAPHSIKAQRRDGERQWYEVVFVDHRDGLVERFFKTLGHPVQRCVQIGVANLRDDLLKKGKGRPLTPKELNSFNETLEGGLP